MCEFVMSYLLNLFSFIHAAAIFFVDWIQSIKCTVFYSYLHYFNMQFTVAKYANPLNYFYRFLARNKSCCLEVTLLFWSFWQFSIRKTKHQFLLSSIFQICVKNVERRGKYYSFFPLFIHMSTTKRISFGVLRFSAVEAAKQLGSTNVPPCEW